MFDVMDLAIAELVEQMYLPLNELRIIDAIQESKRDLLAEAITDLMWECVNGKEIR